MILLFKMPLSVELKCCVVFLGARRLCDVPYGENSVIDKHPSGVGYSAVDHGFSVTE